jgi:DNA ligase-1
MADLGDGESVEVKGSGARPYVLRNVGGVYSCSCPAWRNQSVPIERRTCKHLRRLCGDEAERARVGEEIPRSPEATAETGAGEKAGPPLLLAERWDNAQELAGWWLSEKLDGVCVTLDGATMSGRRRARYHGPGRGHWRSRSGPAWAAPSTGANPVGRIGPLPDGAAYGRGRGRRH